MKVGTVDLDPTKNVFQVHSIDDIGKMLVRRMLRRRQAIPFFRKLGPCLVGMEACGTSHFWAREFEALGHEVRLMPPAYVKPYVKRGKTDAADAEAICEVPDDALRCDQVTGAASDLGAASDAGSLEPI